MNFPPDSIEEQIATIDQAWELINNKIPGFKDLYSTWLSWYQEKEKNLQIQKVIIDAVVISYARMAKRNGSLCPSPRCYHNETHIDDLLRGLLTVSKQSSSKSMPNYAWSILSLFMSCHDLRQAEKIDTTDPIGENEKASYQEIKRLLIEIDSNNVFRQKYKDLLKTMIHGSTFGKGEDTKGNIYQGNLVRYILQNIQGLDDIGVEIAYLACDIDTANVAADISEYAQSSVNVFNEINMLSNKPVSAKHFFGEQQQQYFFDMQRFNSNLGRLTFSKQKYENAKIIQETCDAIKGLDVNLSNDEVVKIYLQKIKKYK